MPIFVVRTIAGRERQVLDKILAVARRREIPIYSILNPAEVKGYIFVEAPSRDDVLQAIYGLGHAKGVIGESVSIDELRHFLTPTPAAITLGKGDIVELISGPFKGEKARVNRVSKIKEEVVVELLEAAVPIPVTVRIDSVRVIKKEEKEE
jgi:transcriptional antiterminator NusG